MTIEKFTRPWQRFLGLGDVHATADAVASAVQERDVEELVKINPAWKPIMDRDELHVLPRLLTPPEVLMIEDNRCTHEWSSCPIARCKNGETNRVTMEHLEPFSKCDKCDIVLCLT